MKGKNNRLLISIVAVFLMTCIIDYLVHNIILIDMYKDTVVLWRPIGQMLMFPMLVSQFLFSIMFVYIFSLNYERKGIQEGMRYGLYIGLLLAAISFGSYSYMPIPIGLAFAWMIAGVIKNVILGCVTAAAYKR